MRRIIGRIWLGAALASGALAGCQASGARPGYLQDPLLVSKKPIVGRPESAATQVAAREPAVPPVPVLPSDGNLRIVRSASPEP
jgi:hypothetical protein